MNKIIDKIKNVHLNVHFLAARKKYSIAFYTGGVKLSEWNSLSKEKQKTALSKEWYVRWSFRNPKTHKLVRQNNIKGGINYYKTKGERQNGLNTFKKNLELLLDGGYSPYHQENENLLSDKEYSTKEALEFVLKLKESTVNKRTYKDYYYEVEKFKKFLSDHLLLESTIRNINKKVVVKYLNFILKNSSSRTRNNSRSNLSSLFSLMKDNFIIETNFIKTDISKLASVGKIDRTLPNDLLLKISEHLKITDPTLLLYIKFVAYNFLRPIEVNRLKVGDINIKEKKLFVYTKNKKSNIKTKRIPDLIIDELKKLNLEQYNSDYYLFTTKDTPGEWQRDDDGRRDVYSKRFKRVVKNKFELGEFYGLYSFRHSFITNLFRVYRIKKKMTFNEAVESLMPITGHTSKEGLSNYIHTIDADIPEDWSSDIEIVL